MTSSLPTPRRSVRPLHVTTAVAATVLALFCLLSFTFDAVAKTDTAAKSNSQTPPKSKSARVLKVLPHFLDRQGRHTVNPSLFDRDSYQFELRQKPELRSGMRFDVLWKGIRGTPSAVLKLQVEMRGSKATAQNPVVVSQRVFATSDFSQWTRLPVVGTDYENLGDLLSWRVSLWKDEELVAEQTSFLW
jgi:hypothetical protein